MVSLLFIICWQLCQFDEEVRMLKTRNASLSKLNSELKMVVDQRNCMIQHLEEALQKQTDKCNALLNCSSETMVSTVMDIASVNMSHTFLCRVTL